MTEIIFYPLLIIFPLALLVGPVGSILVWRRSSFLSDVVSHMGILAFAVAEVMHLPLLLVSVCVSMLTAFLLEWSPSFIPKDAWLSGLSSFGIAVGLILLSQKGGYNFDHVFWGDMFALSFVDVIVCVIAVGFLGMHLIAFWKSLMLVIFHEQLAVLDGIPVRFLKIVVSLISGVVIALCLKLMGVLLTGALFVVPSIGLRFFNMTPERHITGTIILITLSFLGGLFVSISTDIIATPLIILTLIILNFGVLLIKKGIDRKRKK